MSQKQLSEKALQLKRANEQVRLLTAAEAGEILGVAPQTLANWRSAGRGPRYVRIGRQIIRYPQEALEEFASTELSVREPDDELTDGAIIKQIARLANRLARRQRSMSEAAA